MSDIQGKAAREAVSEWSRGDASDIDGQTDRSNGAFGKSDIEGKVARVAARKRGRDRVSNGREHIESMWGNERVSNGAISA
jgi:hypothetical protein